LFAVFGKKGNGDPGHGSILCVHYHVTNFQCRGQMTFVIEGHLRRSGGSPAGSSIRGKQPSRLPGYLIVRQRPVIEKTREVLVVVQFESSHLTIAMEAWKPASLKAMPPQSNIM
jgi:hypothetical protein